MILLIDNYDSFSYNLYQLIGSIRADITVIRNDEKTIDEVAAMAPDAIILSPGPGRPESAGICVEAVKQLGGRFPMLGVCLGHQAICEAYGGVVTYAPELMHGKSSVITLDTGSRLFQGMAASTQAARYHSLAADREQLPECLTVIASTVEGEIMAFEHTTYPVYGVQFHPESILTPEGATIMRNFLEVVSDD